MNKLFILDDFGIDKRGGCYLGEFPDYFYEEATKKLIGQVVQDTKKKNIYFAGTSKGGWAALNIGTLYKDSTIIVGAPQYWLGKYLSAPANKITLDGIVGKNHKNVVVDELDCHLQKHLINNLYTKSQTIYLQYSNKEYTYEDHIVDLIRELENQGYRIIQDIQCYEDHNQVGLFFPQFLLKCLRDK